MWLRTALSSLTPGIGAPLGQLKKTLAQVGLACEGLQVDRWGQVQESGPEGWLYQEPPESTVAPGKGGLGSE